MKLFESLSDASVEAFLELLKLTYIYGVFNDKTIKDIRNNIASGVKGSLSIQSGKMNDDEKREFDEYVDAFLAQIYSSTSMKDLYIAVRNIALTYKDVKNRIVKEALSVNNKEILYKTLSFDILNYNKFTLNFWKETNVNIEDVISSQCIDFITSLNNNIDMNI